MRSDSIDRIDKRLYKYNYRVPEVSFKSEDRSPRGIYYYEPYIRREDAISVILYVLLCLHHTEKIKRAKAILKKYKEHPYRHIGVYEYPPIQTNGSKTPRQERVPQPSRETLQSSRNPRRANRQSLQKQRAKR